MSISKVHKKTTTGLLQQNFFYQIHKLRNILSNDSYLKAEWKAVLIVMVYYTVGRFLFSDKISETDEDFFKNKTNKTFLIIQKSATIYNTSLIS